ncbi:heterokaryon incompatibility protein-domain-containing protein [Fusarium venenatum]|nr:heterokaryon incompatibility protein-domain-containing protein [Fusarium venenatum]
MRFLYSLFVSPTGQDIYKRKQPVIRLFTTRGLNISCAVVCFGILIYELRARSIRLLAFLLPLLYVDAYGSALSQYMAGQGLDCAPNLLAKYEQKPKLAIASAFITFGMIFGVSFLAHPFVRVVLFLTPFCSAALLFYFLLYRHIPNYVAEPLPLPQMSVPPETRFCRVCRTTILAKLRENSGSVDDIPESGHHRTKSSLRSSAVAGCRICTTIWDRLTEEISSAIRYLPSVYFTTYEYSVKSINIHVQWHNHLCAFIIERISSKVIRKVNQRFPPESIPFERYTLPESDLEHHTGSEQSLDQAKTWYSSCIRYHPDCSTNTGAKGFQPSRLLYLGGPENIRIHIRGEYPHDMTYMTLSHCWGSSHFIKLQSDNLDEFRREILWKFLPQTFKDAIRVARYLGSQYLWIDSLCIIQDSLDDWGQEAKAMGEVYRNSMCNIAASSASDSSQGCLYPRNPRILQPEPLDNYGDELKDLYLFNRSWPSKPFTLYTRAWVLQEALLAPRTLDCGQSQLYWRCDAAKASEECPGGYPITKGVYLSHPAHSSSCPNESLRAMVAQTNRRKEDQYRYPEEPRPSTLVKSLALTDEGLQAAVDHWSKIVEAYSNMSLTFEADMPIAIHGAIEAFRPFLGQYYAGMWEYTLPAHLVWMPTWPAIVTTVLHCKRPLVKRAPSWSWMSLIGKIEYKQTCWLHPDYSLIAHVTKVNVVSSAEIQLHLQAPIFKATYVGDAKNSIKRALQTCSILPSTRSKITVINKHFDVKWEISGIYAEKDGTEKSTLRACFDVQEEEDAARDIYLVAITEKSGTEGLVLTKHDNGMYSRLGAFDAAGPVRRIFQDREKTEVVLI